MYYFGRIIGAFFNQLFRFLFWNKFGQKILIAIIIGLIAFWCVGMTEVHAVEEVQDVNYEVRSYYEGIVNDAIIRLSQEYLSGSSAFFFNNYIKTNTESFKFYFYYGNNDGSSYNGSVPLSTRNLNIIINNNWNENNVTWEPTSYDYSGVTGYTMYKITNSGTFSRYTFAGGVMSTNNTQSVFYGPMQLYNYVSPNWIEFVNFVKDDNQQAIRQLLEDIKTEQQATNDFLTEENDDTLMDIQTPTYTDSASESMSSNLHDSINSLTTQMQTTVSNYYEGWDAYSWVIPLPSYIGGNITFDSGVTRKIIGTSGVLYNIIQAVWVILFGGYIIGFIKRMLDWVQTGKIFDEGGLADFIWWMDTNNEIIKASMM